MAKKYTADTFEGAVTGTASGNVAKTGDTMTGDLKIQKSTPVFELNSNSIYPYGRIEFAGTSGNQFEIVGQGNPGTTSLALRSKQGGTMANAFTIGTSSNYSALPLRLGLDSTSGELTYTKTNRTGSVSNSYYLDGAAYGTAEHYQYYTLVGSICTLVGYVSLSTYNSATSVSRMVLPYTAAYRTGAFARQGGHITNWSSSGCTFANTMTNPTCWVEDGTNLLYIQPNPGSTGTTTGRTSGSFAAGCFSGGVATVTLEYSITYRIA